MANEKFTPVTNPDDIEELLKDPTDISKPYPLKPNGHLWVLADEFHLWKGQPK